MKIALTCAVALVALVGCHSSPPDPNEVRMEAARQDAAFTLPEACGTAALEFIVSGVDRPKTVTNFKAKAIREYGYNLIATFQARDRANRVFSGSGRFVIYNAPCRVIKSEKAYWS